MRKTMDKFRSLSQQNFTFKNNNTVQRVSVKNETILGRKLLDQLSLFDDE